MKVLLFWVFATHSPFFAWRFCKTGELRYAATALTFAILALTYGVELWAPDLRVGGVPIHRGLRGAALLSAAVSVGLLARHLLLRRARR